MSLRAFIALPLPAHLRQEIAALQQTLAPVLPRVRWVNPEQMHLTLRFFPALPEECLDQVRETMLSVGNFHAPFQVDIGGFGAFPNLARPRVFWLGLRPEAPLLGLQRHLDEGLHAIGLGGEERPFKPHLTLGRAKDAIRLDPARMTAYQNWAGGTWRVTEMRCYQSRLTPAGALHTSLFHAPLGAGGAP
ncbi:RNA 2',3'-cyclic phosphodiesterase [Geoalkalibacter halelectricus]|uniref:RNA 2',3'-cyclic phosphodiesterase n=1 Tax=Geoalkalibacter halelectricus TaxID=2847045 RepID=UPI003D19B3C7